MAEIDIGPGAIDRASTQTFGYTFLDLNNPANDTGTIDTIELWFATNGSGVKVGTFYGTAPNFTSRDVATIGNVTAGSKQTFSGLSIAVQTNDIIGVYWSGGTLEMAVAGGSGVYYKIGDQFGAGSQTYTLVANYQMSAYGTGETPVVGTTIKPPQVVFLS